MNATGRLKRPLRAKDLLPQIMREKPQTVEELQRELHEKAKRFEAAARKRGHLKSVPQKKHG